jgi:hypothetical protein
LHLKQVDKALTTLEVAGADLDMVSVICTEVDGSGAPTFPRDLHLIAEADPAPTLVIVDAWLDTVPAVLSVRDPQHARQALHPWKEVATATDAAVLLLTHTNRVASASARDRYGITAELRKKCRMTLFAQSDDEGRLIVGPEKMNTAAPIPASTFTISSVQHFEPTADSDGTVPLLVYVGDSDCTAREHIADTFEAEHGEDHQERADAERWLRDYHSKQGPRAKSAEAKREATQAGITDKVLRRARVKLGVKVGYEGMPATSRWSLPEQIEDDDPPVVPPCISHLKGTTGEKHGIRSGQRGYAQSCPRAQEGTSPAETGQNPPVVPNVTETHRPGGTTGARRPDREHARLDSARSANSGEEQRAATGRRRMRQVRHGAREARIHRAQTVPGMSANPKFRAPSALGGDVQRS